MNSSALHETLRVEPWVGMEANYNINDNL